MSHQEAIRSLELDNERLASRIQELEKDVDKWKWQTDEEKSERAKASRLSAEIRQSDLAKISALEAQLAAMTERAERAEELARLERALQRIEVAGYLRKGLFCDTIIIAGNQESVLRWCFEIDTQSDEKEFYGKTPAEAVEAAVAWAESRKGG